MNASLHLPLTQLILNLPLNPTQLPQFRGAIAEHAGLHNEWFHNHDNENGGLHYRYPLIQYHTVGGMAAILGVGEGAEAITQWMETYQGRLFMDGRWHTAPIIEHNTEQASIGSTETWQTYQLHDWIALNETNYRTWKTTQRKVHQLEVFERAFVGQVLAFARGLDWFVERRLEAQLLDLSEPRWRKRSGTELLVFDAQIKIQALLPHGIGLGKGASIGFGRVAGNES